MIELDRVTKTYDELTVLRDISLQLPENGITAIIGPNGAGKSTLLSIIARLLPMSAGSVRVDGMDVRKTPSADLAKRLAILRQNNDVAMRLTVGELVAFGRFPHSQGRLNEEDKRHIHSAIDYLGLGALQDRFIDELSGGQRQRAFVAMVLAQDTKYVLLDEPLNSLDMKHARAMMKRLRRTADEWKKSVIIVIHDINFAAVYADRIIAMRDGSIVLDGTADDLMREETLEAIYDTPIRVHEIEGHKLGLYHL
ncbi:ABC transporter ATP-binding protein [Notoacmeibacter ruber]|uniref:ATP-binding cassette domain-containing protein n=1 Tax=Notoacmeibacter ruber TaxID=2670375 RepID=A0A3L7J8I1_9HYPH|nr:ATP-binding cassette domain-containing protein [Notoacmeibacter ruber]RLQ86840.1 ATP-binding cassette domain-containing protein [Notoacmeibacter ruber]